MTCYKCKRSNVRRWADGVCVDCHNKEVHKEKQEKLQREQKAMEYISSAMSSATEPLAMAKALLKAAVVNVRRLVSDGQVRAWYTQIRRELAWEETRGK